ncbi:hypothetical protein [Luteolibacter soli]|uniref:Uncharacterized protein n=1 Tax=Luteolibacter soli TaxID=3135280 RepID=A0ABU9B0B1_9BACT
MIRLARLILHRLGLADHPEPWNGPVGDFFISDKDATCDYLSQRFSQEAVEILGKILGFTMVAKINGRAFLISRNYVEEMTAERVVRRGRDFLTTVGYSAIWERQRRSTIYRSESGQGYWVASDRPLHGYREHFRSISADEFQALTAHIPRDPAGYPIVTPPDESTLQTARSLSQSSPRGIRLD